MKAFKTVAVPAFLALTLSVSMAGIVHAQATIADCEKIQAADAYNQCLAKFGPPAKSGNLEPERPGDIKSGPAEAAATAGKARRGHATARRHRGHGGGHIRVHRGRQRMYLKVR